MPKLQSLSVLVLILAAYSVALPMGRQALAQTPKTPTPKAPVQTATPTKQPSAPNSFPVEATVNGAVLGLTVIITGGVLWKLHQAVSESRAELEGHLDKRYREWEKCVSATQKEREKLTTEQIALREQTWELEKRALENLAETRQRQLAIRDLELEQAKDALSNTWNVLRRVIHADLRELAPPLQSMALRRLMPEVEMVAKSASDMEEHKLAQVRVRALVEAQDQILDLVQSRVERGARDYLLLGNAHYQAGNYPRAVTEYRRAIEMTPDDPIVRINLGTTYEMMSEFDAAIESFTTALSTETIKRLPKYEAVAFNNLGIVYYRTGQIEKAVESYSKAIELREDYKDAYLNRSAAYEKLGRPRKAAGDRKKAAALSANLQNGKASPARENDCTQ